MECSYNLLDEPWIPVRLADGQVLELGLLDTFRRSGEIVALAETAPPSLVAQYRLLLAILHRALSQSLPAGWKDPDRAGWYREGLPADRVIAYLERWREHFWLFHPEQPFLQVAVLAQAEETRDKRKPWTQIDLASANGNAPVVFDHACDAAPRAISPTQALTTLLGFLQFTPGGLVKVLRDADKAGALVNTAAILPLGATLAQTLALCLHPAPGRQAQDDLPAWERPPLTLADLRGDPLLATGPNDRYTRQSRAVLLLREADGNIRWLHFAAGQALGEDSSISDPMASFRQGTNGLVRLTFNEGRALWRDLPTLVPTPSSGNKAAAVLNLALAVHECIDPFALTHQPLLVAGVASDQAKLLRWRAEQLRLPLALLAQPDRAQALSVQVARADELFKELGKLAVSLLADTLPDSTSKDTRSRARSLLDAGPFALSYFAAVERALPSLYQQLAKGLFEEADATWGHVMRRSADDAWKLLLRGLGSTPQALRADARFLPRFYGLLNKAVPKAVTHPEASA